MVPPFDDEGEPVPSLSEAARRERVLAEEEFARLAALSGTGAWAPALEAFSCLENRLRRCMRRAEDVLFPLFELRAGATELTRTLVRQHREIERYLADLLICLRDQNLDALPERVRELRGALEEHEGRAGRLVYPLLDRLLSEDERRLLVSNDGDGGGPVGPVGRAD